MGLVRTVPRGGQEVPKVSLLFPKVYCNSVLVRLMSRREAAAAGAYSGPAEEGPSGEWEVGGASGEWEEPVGSGRSQWRQA